VNNDNITYRDESTVTGGRLSDIRSEQRAGAARGADLLAGGLKAEGVGVLFGYPGGANLEIFDVLAGAGIRCVRTEHEQGAVHAAQGYARASGRVGVCLATSGPGVTNLVTGLADANSDSTPVVAITGNVPTPLLGKNAFQEVDIVAITRPITKKSTLVRRVSEIPEVVREAFALAAGNQPGPVLIDIPKDIQQHYPKDASGNYTPPPIPAVIEQPEATVGGLGDHQLAEACRLIVEAERPVIYAGGGIVAAGCAEALQQLAEALACPVTTTVMGHGILPPEHPLALGCLGMHGAKVANVAVNEADLVLALGVRFDDRVTGRVDAFIADGRIIHVDIDRSELNKNKAVTLPLCADLAMALPQLVACAQAGERGDWLVYLDGLRRDFPYPLPRRADRISPQQAIARLSELTGGNAIVSLGVGQHQMWAMQHYRSRRPRGFLSSSGFGTMGYGLPAAIGAKVACPDVMVIDIDGDGSLNMTVHELATCRRYGIGAKVVVINNQWLGMVRQWQDMIYDGNRAESGLADPMAVKAPGEQDIYPDFPTIAAGYRVKAERVSHPDALDAALKRLLADPDQPYLLDVIVAAEENVYPMIPVGGSYAEMIMGPEGLLAGTRERQGSNI
jgi:acetolactate synthase-1/2/3 large subunit